METTTDHAAAHQQWSISPTSSGGESVDTTKERSRYGDRKAVAGVAGGVGTTSLATAIGAVDHGVFVGRPVDVLVSRATGDSLVRAGRAIDLIHSSTGIRPVLAVTVADSVGPSRPISARLRLLEPHAAAIVVLPYVRRWRELTAPLDEIGSLLGVPRSELPRAARRYADVARHLRCVLGLTPTVRAAASRRVAPVPRSPAPTSRRSA